MEINKIIILGGVVIDIISKTSNNEILNNSNIGEIDLKIGGSGRNCAECIARLGYSKDILLISAIGKDDTLKNEMINQ
jgi:sugar/nucleoside kinase (ribokinase family)